MNPPADTASNADAAADDARPERPPGRHPRGGGDRVHRHRRARRLLPRRRRTGGQGLLGHRALRDGGPRARGLPGPAPHQRRAHPDRQGLPLLRRPPDPAGRPRPGPAPAGVATSSTSARRDGGHARAGYRPALGADLVRRGGGRALARRGHHPLGPAGRPGPRQALLVVVLSDGAVEKRTMELDVDLGRGAGPGRRAALGPPGRAHACRWLARAPSRGRAALDQLVARRRARPSSRSRRGPTGTRSSSAVRPGWPSPSTPWRRCAPC